MVNVVDTCTIQGYYVYMHSSDYLRLAQAADGFGYVIVAFVELAPAEGTYPAAYCLLHDPDRPAERAYATSMGVLPDNGEAFFTSSSYDYSRSKGLQVFADLDLARVYRDALDAEDAIGAI